MYVVCILVGPKKHTIDVTFSHKNKINHVKVEAKIGGILSLLFKFLIRIMKGKLG